MSMLFSVHLDDESFADTAEVDDPWSDAVLSPEFPAEELP
jgi:hypothetical protein